MWVSRHTDLETNPEWHGILHNYVDPIFSFLLLLVLLPFRFSSYHLSDVGGRFLPNYAALGGIGAGVPRIAQGSGVS